MCATTQYESVSCQSNGMSAVIVPFNPPMMKVARKPSAKHIEVVSTMRPRQSVAIHANTCTVLKMEIVMLAALPIGANVYLMSRQFGVLSAAVASAIVLTTAAAAFTMPVTLALIGAGAPR